MARWVPHGEYFAQRQSQKGPTLIPDIDPYLSPMSGAVINTRRERRREMLDNHVIDGREAAKELKRHDKYRHTKWARNGR